MPATRIVITAGDLTEQRVDAVGSGVKNELVLGGGVGGAMRMRGGSAIQRECDAHGPVEVGKAAITGAGELPCRHVIHAASMHLGGRTTADSLRSSMDDAFRLAQEHGVRTIAVPAVGTGIAGFPMDECAPVMARCVTRALTGGWQPEEICFELFWDAARSNFEETFYSA